MSSTRQTVVRGPNLSGFGKRPSLTPCHHVDFDTGIGPAGARIADNRTKPVWGECLVGHLGPPARCIVQGYPKWFGLN